MASWSGDAWLQPGRGRGGVMVVVVSSRHGVEYSTVGHSGGARIDSHQRPAAPPIASTHRPPLETAHTITYAAQQMADRMPALLYRPLTAGVLEAVARAVKVTRRV